MPGLNVMSCHGTPSYPLRLVSLPSLTQVGEVKGQILNGKGLEGTYISTKVSDILVYSNFPR